MHQMGKKIKKVTSLFKDTLLYSSKTYFLEEIYRQKEQNTKLEEKVHLLIQKIYV